MAIETECSAIKAGNVHPTASFDDLNYQHFLTAAHAIGEAVDRCLGCSVGAIALSSTRAMMHSAGTNTSLGTILLLSPLITTLHRDTKLPNPNSVGQTLAHLTPEDARDIYLAIQNAKPGGMGDSPAMDVRGAAPTDIIEAMRLAADWDDIALQYATQFEIVFAIAQRLKDKIATKLELLDAVRCLQMELLAERIDSLIARKQGRDFAVQIQRQAKTVLASGPYGSEAYESEWHRFDNAIRDQNHRGNPGTIADLLAAAIFLTLIS